METKSSSKSRKFKPNKKFKPITVDEDDERYANGVFDFNVTKLLTFIRANPDKILVEEVAGKSLRTFSAANLNEATVQGANLSVPIILAEISPGRFNVIDGNHRLEKAHRDGLDKIPIYRVMAEHHIAFLTSERAYNAYVEYWNSKIDDDDE